MATENTDRIEEMRFVLDGFASGVAIAVHHRNKNRRRGKVNARMRLHSFLSEMHGTPIEDYWHGRCFTAMKEAMK